MASLAERVRALGHDTCADGPERRALADEVERLEASEYVLEHPLVDALVARFGLQWPDRIVERFGAAGLVDARSIRAEHDIARLLHEMGSK